MTIGIIPARYASTRFPGKPLVDIGGKSMVLRVYEQAKKAQLLHDVVVATDDERIEKHVMDFGGNVVMTHADHPSGTDRCLEAAFKFNPHATSVINIQGDEPFIEPVLIDTIAKLLLEENTEIATLVKLFTSHSDLTDPSKVKAVLNLNGNALYFSRQPIPHLRGHEEATDWTSLHKYYHHIGIYGYTIKTLQHIARLSPSPLEKAESLEQLRWLEHGFSIKTAVAHTESFGIDTPEDLKKALKKTENNTR